MILYRLDVLMDGGRVWTVFGTKEVMESASDEIERVLSATDGTGPKTMKISGMCDTADRAEKTVVLRTDCIQGCDLTKLY